VGVTQIPYMGPYLDDGDSGVKQHSNLKQCAHRTTTGTSCSCRRTVLLSSSSSGYLPVLVVQDTVEQGKALHRSSVENL
jgi:hypothetical protein